MNFRKLIIPFVIFAFSSTSGRAQYVFQREIGNSSYDWGNDIIQTADSNFVLLGESMYSAPGGTRPDIVLFKLGQNGDTLSSKRFVQDGYDYPNCIIENPDGSMIFWGATSSFLGTGTGALMSKMDANWNLQWTKIIDAGGSSSHIVDAKRLPDGSYVAVSFLSITSSHNAAFRYDALGNLIWSRYYSTFLISSTERHSKSLDITTDGNVITCGRIQYGSGKQNLLLTKLNSTDGTVIWCRAYGDSTYFHGTSVVATSDGGFLAGGQIGSYDDIVLFRTDNLGNLHWAKRYGTTSGEEIRSIVETSDGGFLLSGSTGSIASGGFTNGDAILVKIDSSGNVQWANRYGGTWADIFQRAKETLDGYIATGSSMEPTTSTSNILLVKTDLNGNSGCRNLTLPLTVSNFISLSTNWPSYGSPTSLTTISPTLTEGYSGLTNNLLCIANVGVDESIGETHLVYPNPSSADFTFTGLEKNSILKIFDVTGKEILLKKCDNESTTINLNSFSRGMYFYQVFNLKNKMSGGKLILD